MNKVKHIISNILGFVFFILMSMSLMVGCQKESNKFKMNNGMQFKETEKSQLEGKGNLDNGQEGKNRNPNKEGEEQEEETPEEETTTAPLETEQVTEPESVEKETSKKADKEEVTEKESSNKEKETEKEGNKKDENKDGNEEGTGGNGKDYTADYTGETIEIFVDIENE